MENPSENFKILLIVPKLGNGRSADFNYTFPLGIAYISAYLKSNNYNVDVINLNHIDGKAVAALRQTIQSFDCYQVIMTGGMESHYLQIKELISYIKTQTSAPIIVGGPIFNGDSAETFRGLNPDIGIMGEGEIAIVNVVNSLRKNESYKKLHSVIYMEKNRVIVNPRFPQMTDLDELPYPDYQGFGYEEYLNNTNCNAIFYSGIFDYPRIYMICGSRGCPYHCSFCTHTIGDKYITRSMDSIFKELAENIVRYKINIVNVADDLLAYDRDRVIEFCKRFTKLRQDLDWECVWWSNLTAKTIDEELVQILIASGCFLIGIGYESYSQEILKSMRKPLKLSQIDRSFELINSQKICLGSNFIIGDFEETKETFDATMKFIKKRAKGQVNLLGIIPSLGTELYNKFRTTGIIKDQVKYLESQSITYTDRAIFMTIKPPKISSLRHYLMLREMTVARYNHYAIAKVKIGKDTNDNSSISFTCPFCLKHQIYKNISAGSNFFFFYFGYCRECSKRILFLSSSFVKFIPMINYVYDIWFLLKKISFMYYKAKKKITLNLPSKLF